MSERVDQDDSVFATDVRRTLPGVPAESEVALEEGLGEAAEPIPLSQWQLFYRRFKRHKLAVASLVILILLFVLCYGADWIAPYEKGQQDLTPGSENQSPSWDHLFGTDQLGRDYFSEVLYAGQVSLRIGLTVAILSTFVGSSVPSRGTSAGGWISSSCARPTCSSSSRRWPCWLSVSRGSAAARPR
jgi:N-terminal TM domain of oligopeptide transport permease C